MYDVKTKLIFEFFHVRVYKSSSKCRLSTNSPHRSTVVKQAQVAPTLVLGLAIFSFYGGRKLGTKNLVLTLAFNLVLTNLFMFHAKGSKYKENDMGPRTEPCRKPQS